MAMRSPHNISLAPSKGRGRESLLFHLDLKSNLAHKGLVCTDSCINWNITWTVSVPQPITSFVLEVSVVSYPTK